LKDEFAICRLIRRKTLKGDIVMRRFLFSILAITLLPAVVYICSCASGGAIDFTDPITPLPELSEGVADPITREITVTKNGVTVIVQHWSRRRLNRKYTTVDMRSPFYYLETWEQSFQSEVFQVTIKNDTTRRVIVNLDQTLINDDRKYIYRIQGIDEFKYKFVTKKMMDLKTKRGIQIAKQTLLNEVLGEKREVLPGTSVQGFLSFPGTSSIVTKLWVTLVLEMEPELATASYERVEYRFDFNQDPVARKRQLPMRR